MASVQASPSPRAVAPFGAAAPVLLQSPTGSYVPQIVRGATTAHFPMAPPSARPSSSLGYMPVGSRVGGGGACASQQQPSQQSPQRLEKERSVCHTQSPRRLEREHFAFPSILGQPVRLEVEQGFAGPPARASPRGPLSSAQAAPALGQRSPVTATRTPSLTPPQVTVPVQVMSPRAQAVMPPTPTTPVRQTPTRGHVPDMTLVVQGGLRSQQSGGSGEQQQLPSWQGGAEPQHLLSARQTLPAHFPLGSQAPQDASQLLANALVEQPTGFFRSSGDASAEQVAPAQRLSINRGKTKKRLHVPAALRTRPTQLGSFAPPARARGCEDPSGCPADELRDTVASTASTAAFGSTGAFSFLVSASSQAASADVQAATDSLDSPTSRDVAPSLLDDIFSAVDSDGTVEEGALVEPVEELQPPARHAALGSPCGDPPDDSKGVSGDGLDGHDVELELDMEVAPKGYQRRESQQPEREPSPHQSPVASTELLHRARGEGGSGQGPDERPVKIEELVNLMGYGRVMLHEVRQLWEAKSIGSSAFVEMSLQSLERCLSHCDAHVDFRSYMRDPSAGPLDDVEDAPARLDMVHMRWLNRRLADVAALATRQPS